MLKPQDMLLALKYWPIRQSKRSFSVRRIAESAGISANEVSKGNKRLLASHLVVAHKINAPPFRSLFVEYSFYNEL